MRGEVDLDEFTKIIPKNIELMFNHEPFEILVNEN